MRGESGVGGDIAAFEAAVIARFGELAARLLQDRLEAALAEAAEEQTPFDPAAERPPHY